ncbi:MAG: DNA polymerase III subunit beta [Patescibacteria group bacterium]|nr:MAG: DNA polymerase III subunit beta [Patescibacteria group bacterium]
MKLKVLQENLNGSLAHLSKAIPNNPQLPVLSSVLITTENGICTFSATDLYFGIRCSLVVDSETDGSIVVPGKQFREIVSSLDPGVLELLFKDNSLAIANTKTNISLAGSSTHEYPPFPQVEGEEYVFPIEYLEQIENNIIFSASTDQARPVLTAVLFVFNNSGLTCVSTDGFRLSTLIVDDTQKFESKTFLIPAKALSEVFKIASKLKVKEVRFKVSQELKQVFFSLEGVEVFVRLIEGEYPPYERIIPSSFTTEVVFDTAELLEALKRAMIFARESSNIVRFEISENKVIIHSSSPSFGQYKGELQLVTISGEQNEIAFNIKYLLDYLSVTKSEKQWFGMSESLKPALFIPENNKKQSYVVMPFKVNN